VDVAFLKLFLSTEYVDLSHLEQASPFKAEGARATRAGPASPGIGRAVLKTISTWDTIVIPVLNQKPKDGI
jgi:hypothetical protein